MCKNLHYYMPGFNIGFNLKKKELDFFKRKNNLLEKKFKSLIRQLK